MSFDAKNYNILLDKYEPEESNRELIRDIMSGFSHKKYDIVLDVGCNAGQKTALLASELNVGHVYGIDFSEDVIEIAKRNHSKDNISFYAQDFSVEFDSLVPELKALEGKVSLIYSSEVFELLPTLDNFPTNIHRLLAKGGLICARTLCFDDPYMDLMPEEKAIHEKEFMKMPDPHKWFNAMIDAFKSVGFAVISQTSGEYDYPLKMADYRQHFVPIMHSVYKPYLIVNSEDTVKQLERKFFSTYRCVTDETTGEEWVHSIWKHNTFCLKK